MHTNRHQHSLFNHSVCYFLHNNYKENMNGVHFEDYTHYTVSIALVFNMVFFLIQVQVQNKTYLEQKKRKIWLETELYVY